MVDTLPLEYRQGGAQQTIRAEHGNILTGFQDKGKWAIMKHYQNWSSALSLIIP